MNKIRLLLVDDHALLNESLKRIIEMQAPDMQVVGTATSGGEGVEKARALRPDVVLMDISMPGMSGIQCTREILAVHPRAKVIMLTSFMDDDSIFKALREGATGYLMKSMKPEDVIAGIRATLNGGIMIEPRVAARVVDVVRMHSPAKPTELLENLTPRELEILRLIAQCNTNQEIARTLNISPGTASNYVCAIYTKLGVRDRVQAARYATEHGLA